MLHRKEIRFAIAILLAAIVLRVFTFDETRIVQLRWEPLLRTDGALLSFLQRDCQVITPLHDNPYEKFFAETFRAKSSEASHRCLVEVESAFISRFHLTAHGRMLLKLRSLDLDHTYSGNFLIQYPEPLGLLALLGFLLSLLLEVGPFPPIVFGLLHLFLLNELNLIQTFAFCRRTIGNVISSDQGFMGLLFIILWLGLMRARRRVQTPDATMPPTGPQPLAVFMKGASSFLGMWNPVFFTVFRKYLLPVRPSLKQLYPLLNLQVFLTCLSLYFLVLDYHHLSLSLTQNLLLPRYFSFAVIVFFTLNRLSGKTPDESGVLSRRSLVAALVSVATMEVLTLFIPGLNQYNFLTRLGASLLLGELCSSQSFPYKKWIGWTLPTVGLLGLGCWLPIVAYESGLSHLALVLCDPSLHPNSDAFFAFLAGTAVAFVTGNFSISFFTLFELLRHYEGATVIRAALLDGILVGILLCPYSLLNLFVMRTSTIGLRDTLSTRFRQLAAPISVASAVYLVGILQGLHILRALVFIFLLMVVLALKLRKSRWIISNSTFWLDARNDPR